MAARRLLIVMLVLLGLSTLAAALVPQGTLNEGDTTGTTTTQPTATTATPPNPAFLRPTKITVGGKKFPVVSPVDVGSQLTLLVRSRFPTQIAIPEFGLVGFATPETPARFELLVDTPGTFGILFGASPKPGVEGKPAARVVVVRPGAKQRKKKAGKAKKKSEKSRSRAPAGSGQA
jgi:hypothetical protein